LGAQTALYHPDEGMEPIQGADETSHELRQRIAARNVGELVTENDATMILGPLERILRKENHRGKRAPGEWSADDRAGEKLDRARHARLEAGGVENLLPISCGKRPGIASDATEPNATDDEPGEDDENAQRPCPGQRQF